MEFGIVGIKSLVGVRSKKSNQDMNAFILHMVRENPRDDRLKGCEVKQQYIDADFLAEDIKRFGGYGQLVGMHIDINYDDGGFVDSVLIKEPAK